LAVRVLSFGRVSTGEEGKGRWWSRRGGNLFEGYSRHVEKRGLMVGGHFTEKHQRIGFWGVAR